MPLAIYFILQIRYMLADSLHMFANSVYIRGITYNTSYT